MLYRLRNLAYKSVQEIALEMATLLLQKPNQEKLGDVIEIELDLSSNQLGTKTADELIQIFTAIPLVVTTLHLGCNQLDRLSASELKAAFSVLNISVNTIYLNDNELKDKKLCGIIQAFTSRRPVILDKLIEIKDKTFLQYPVFFTQPVSIQAIKEVQITASLSHVL
ncbi:MAG: hypothetical protein H0U57_03520 [Tatlockia sp.]|nr:hypothetical protein [Tatlockia sp.]